MKVNKPQYKEHKSTAHIQYAVLFLLIRAHTREGSVKKGLAMRVEYMLNSAQRMNDGAALTGRAASTYHTANP